MTSLRETVKQEVRKYAVGGRGANILLFAILDDEQGIYAVNAVDYPKHTDVAGVVILARVVNDVVVIEEDMADKKLVDALMQAGITRDHIVLAYDNEPIPDADAYKLDA